MPALRLDASETPPVEPLTLTEAKAHLRIESGVTEEDALVEALIRTAREACESFTNRALVARGLTLWLDAWPRGEGGGLEEGWREGPLLAGAARALPLPRPPLRSIDYVKIHDESDAAESWSASNYYVDAASAPGRLVARSGVAWPQPGRAANGIEIRFQAGYAPDESGSPSDYRINIPQALRDGMKRLIARLYEDRGEAAVDGMEGAAEASGAALLWRPYRVQRL